MTQKHDRRSAAYQNTPRNGVAGDPYGGAHAADAAYRERQAAARRSREYEAAEAHRRATEGLPDGYFRDPCGIVRNRETGRIAEVEQREREDVASVNKQIAEQHKAWLASGVSEEQLFDKPASRKRTRRSRGKGVSKRARLKAKVATFVQEGEKAGSNDH